MNQPQHRPLVAAREGIQEPSGLPLALHGLGVGQGRLACQLTRPYKTVAQEMAVEELPEKVRNTVYSRTGFKCESLKIVDFEFFPRL